MAQNKTKANVLRGERAESILDRDGATSTPPFFDGVILSRAGEHVFVDAELGRSHLIRGTASRANRHDVGSTTARSVDEVALIRGTIRHYPPVLIASLWIRIRRAGVQKILGPAATPTYLSRTYLKIA
jgi:hypothetical protein